MPEWVSRLGSRKALPRGVLAVLAVVLVADFLVLVTRDDRDDRRSLPALAAGQAIGADIYKAKTLRIVDQLSAGRYDEVTDDFTPQLREQVPVARVKEIWELELTEGGLFAGKGDPVVTVRGDLQLVEVPVRFERRDKKVRVAYNAGGQVAGFFVLP